MPKGDNLSSARVNARVSPLAEAFKRFGKRARDRAIAIYFAPKETRELRLNRDTNLLKIFACLTMFADHLGKMIFPGAFVLAPAVEFLPAMNIMRAVGRLAMPVFCYCIAVGGAYSRNVWKYALRLILLAVLVQPLYVAAMGHVDIGAFDWAANFYRVDLIYEHYFGRLNILFSLFLGVMLLGSFRAKAYVLSALIAVVVWRYQGMLDYGWKAIGLIGLFYAFLNKPLASFAAVSLFMLNWAAPNLIQRGMLASNTQIYAILSLPLIYLPLKRRVKLPKYLFYAFYPAHLLIIYLLLI